MTVEVLRVEKDATSWVNWFLTKMEKGRGGRRRPGRTDSDTTHIRNTKAPMVVASLLPLRPQLKERKRAEHGIGRLRMTAAASSNLAQPRSRFVGVT